MAERSVFLFVAEAIPLPLAHKFIAEVARAATRLNVPITYGGAGTVSDPPQEDELGFLFEALEHSTVEEALELLERQRETMGDDFVVGATSIDLKTGIETNVPLGPVDPKAGD